MTKFVTIMSCEFPTSTLLWEEQDGEVPKLIGRFASFDDVPDGRFMDVHRFEVPTTAQTATHLNGGHYAVFDADGAPLWEGARIKFTLPTHYINTDEGTGVFKKVDMQGGTQFTCDVPRNVYGPGGFIVEKRREQYENTNTYHYNGELRGARTLSGKIGDPHEHGSVNTFIRLNEDPRSVCKLVREAEPLPAASRSSNF
jgi:hypothetical protein